MEDKTNSSFSAPTLCAKCCSFYANPEFGTYCSKCFKELNLHSAVEKQTATIQKPELVPSLIADVQNTVSQTDHSLCWNCNKKAGMMAYKCKCEYTFCKKHRLPESHSCDFDFINEGKRVLTKLNPNCQSDKIERL